MDQRREKSRQAIRMALCDLTEEKGFANVAVSEVAKRAGVGRSTFYQHYRSIDAVLYEIEDLLIARLVELASRPSEDFEDYIVEIAKGIVPWAVPIRTVLSSSYDHFQLKLENTLVPFIDTSDYPMKGDYSMEERRLIVTFLLDGSIGTVAAFLRTHKEPREEEIEKLVRSFFSFFTAGAFAGKALK